LEFRKNALNEIVKLAMLRKTGARALRSVMESIMLDLMYRAPDMENVVKVVIDKDVVLGKKDYKIVKRDV